MFRKAIVFLFLIVPVLALAYSSPVTDAYARYWASPGNTSGLVNDFAAILSAEQKTALETGLASFEKETGNEIAVAIIKNLGGDAIENYAEELFKEWGIGKKNADNGVLLLVSLEDREMRIEVGYGLEGALTDSESKWILDGAIAPFFKDGKYYEGIAAGMDKIAEAVKGEIVSESSPKKSGKIPFNVFIVVAWFLFVALASILGKSKSWWTGGIVGGIIGVIVGIIKGFVFVGAIALAVLIPFGLIFDYFVSRSYQKSKLNGGVGPWWLGGGKGGGLGDGFGGFGGGSSGGGGSSSKW